MGTRSRIAVQLPDASFKSIYCHWDGYPSHNGKILQDHYNDVEKVTKLVSLGDMSSLGERIGRKHGINKRPAGSCTFYGRDRGEKGVEATVSKSLKDLYKLTQESGGEWLYVFMDSAWWCGEGGVAFFGAPADKAPAALKLLSEVLAMKEHAA